MENKGGDMGLIILSIALLILITIVTMGLEYIVGQTADESNAVKAIWLAALIGAMALNLTVILSPIWGAVYSYGAFAPSPYGLPIDLGVVALVVLVIVINLLFFYLCVGMGIDSFRGRPRRK